jgi:hypothetical protein
MKDGVTRLDWVIRRESFAQWTALRECFVMTAWGVGEVEFVEGRGRWNSFM